MTTEQALPAPPPRRTRPRNRRDLIIAAASMLFYQRGYAGVSMIDIADAVAVRPSALYRHFTGKQELLGAAVLDRIARIEDALADIAKPHVIASLAEVALDQRETGLLWQREGRHLSEPDSVQASARLRAIWRRVSDLVSAARPALDSDDAELLAYCAIAVLGSPSFHHLELPRAEHVRLLTELADNVIRAQLPPAVESAEPQPAVVSPRLSVRSRRETILNTAITMFARQGYSAVSMEDIAAQVGVTGPNIYNYFPSKADLLLAGFLRGTEWLNKELVQAVEQARDHTDALHRLMRSYVTFTLGNNHLVDLMITEQGSLSTDDQVRARHTQHVYIAEWVHILTTVKPGFDAVSARIRVQAWFTVVNDIARTPRLRGRPGLPAALDAIGSAVLGVSGERPG